VQKLGIEVISGVGLPMSRYERIGEDLRRQIVTGELQPGDRMPTEKTLAERYGVAVLTVRQAQQALVQQGLIRKEQGRGTFVSDLALAQRRAWLVCGLAHPGGGTPAQMASAYYLHSIQFCGQAGIEQELPVETAWIENAPAAQPAAVPVVSGMIFLACTPHHHLVERTRAEGAHHVHLGKTEEAERTVWFDMTEAARLGWTSIREEVSSRGLPVVAVSAQGEHSGTAADPVRGQYLGVAALAELVPGGIRHLWVANSLPVWQCEQFAYQATRRLCAEGTGPMAFVFLDEVLARGGTRALLEAGLGEGRCPVAVVSGLQEMEPYGLPVSYVTHDTETEASWAVEMLAAQLEGDPAGAASRRSPFTLAAQKEHLHADPADRLVAMA